MAEEENNQNRPNAMPSEEQLRKMREEGQGQQEQEQPQQEQPVPGEPASAGPEVDTSDPANYKNSKELSAAEEMRRRRERELKQRNAQPKDPMQEKQQMLEQQQLKQRTLADPMPPSEDSTTKERVEQGESNEYTKEKEGTLPPGDYIGLPSDGKIYRHKKDRIRVSYLTASDENILTSVNLIESGEFLKVLINKKIMDEDIHYEDLHVGDRNAILLWLRGTGYGTLYPISLTDPKTGEEFETEVDISNLQTKELKAEPDENGLFDFTLPLSKSHIKFKLLVIRDIEDIEEQVRYEMEDLGYKIDNSVTYRLNKHIIEVDGRTDRPYISQFIDNMRVGDSRALRNYIDEIEPGIDLNVTVRTPGGESVTTFLPLGPRFFWPDS